MGMDWRVRGLQMFWRGDYKDLKSLQGIEHFICYHGNNNKLFINLKAFLIYDSFMGFPNIQS